MRAPSYQCPHSLLQTIVYWLEDLGNRLHGLALSIDVHVGVDVHGDLGAVVAGELLHDLWVHAVQGQEREIAVAQFVGRPAL